MDKSLVHAIIEKLVYKLPPENISKVFKIPGDIVSKVGLEGYMFKHRLLKDNIGFYWSPMCHTTKVIVNDNRDYTKLSTVGQDILYLTMYGIQCTDLNSLPQLRISTRRRLMINSICDYFTEVISNFTKEPSELESFIKAWIKVEEKILKEVENKIRFEVPY